MKSLLLLLLPAVLGANGKNVCRVNNRILGGVRADKSEFPGLVYLQINSWNGTGVLRTQCGGSMISEHWVLTAAHCLTPEDPSEQFLSVWVYPTKGSYQNIKSTDVIIHEEYDKIRNDNDIALIRLPVPMSSIDPHSKITPIPAQDQELTNTEVTVVGWGVTSTKEALFPTYLQKLEHFPVNQTLCQRTQYSPSKVLCHYPTRATGTPCPGDSGGPVFMDGLQVGIVSFTGTFRYYFLPGFVIEINTRVSGYRDWIDAKIRSDTS
ncbi:chymotrypsin-2-like [Anabrus simplex]|uniref:chymotrypsin-2-like n=1 Tax=Anabrus simplex TaxID=316456 RepID=UPI0035A2847C